MEKAIQLSLEQQRPIIIMYMGKKEISRRKIQVLRIEEDRVYAYCYLREKHRYFLLEGILSAQLIN